MRLVFVAAALGTTCASAVAQGQLSFANYAPLDRVDAPVFDAPQFGGGRLAGNAFAADLYWGPDGTTDSNLLVPLNQPAFFHTGAEAGYFLGGIRTFSGLTGGVRLVLQVRAWDTADGASWLECRNSSSSTARSGESNLIALTLTIPPGVPPNLVGLESFSLVPVPEPSAMALAVLGVASLLISRCRLRE